MSDEVAKDDDYVFLPGTHEYVASNGTKVTIHAGNGITVKQFAPVVRAYVEFRDKNAKERMNERETE